MTKAVEWTLENAEITVKATDHTGPVELKATVPLLTVRNKADEVWPEYDNVWLVDTYVLEAEMDKFTVKRLSEPEVSEPETDAWIEGYNHAKSEILIELVKRISSM